MLKIFAKMIVLPVMMILIALSFTVSILSKIHYLAAVLVNAIFIMCAVIALSLQRKRPIRGCIEISGCCM